MIATTSSRSDGKRAHARVGYRALWLALFLLAAYVGWWVHKKVLRDSAPASAANASQFNPTAGARPQEAASSQLLPDFEIASLMDPPSGTESDELATLTKEQLYRRAQAAGIYGRSTMSKDELLAALRSHQQ